MNPELLLKKAHLAPLLNLDTRAKKSMRILTKLLRAVNQAQVTLLNQKCNNFVCSVRIRLLSKCTAQAAERKYQKKLSSAPTAEK